MVSIGAFVTASDESPHTVAKNGVDGKRDNVGESGIFCMIVGLGYRNYRHILSVFLFAMGTT